MGRPPDPQNKGFTRLLREPETSRIHLIIANCQYELSYPWEDNITLQQRYRSHAVSKGTLDIDDLLFRCFGFICQTHFPMDQADLELMIATEHRMANTVYFGNPQDNREKRMQLLTDNVLSVLKRIAPRGCFFGIHPGDPGRVGFWPNSLRFQKS
jgi:hypothetical protein